MRACDVQVKGLLRVCGIHDREEQGLAVRAERGHHVQRIGGTAGVDSGLIAAGELDGRLPRVSGECNGDRAHEVVAPRASELPAG